VREPLPSLFLPVGASRTRVRYLAGRSLTVLPGLPAHSPHRRPAPDRHEPCGQSLCQRPPRARQFDHGRANDGSRRRAADNSPSDLRGGATTLGAGDGPVGS